MKRTPLVVGGLLTAVALVLGAWVWAAGGDERQRELEWLRALAAWSDRIDERIDGSDLYPAANCSDSYAIQVGEPPERLKEADRRARLACRSLSRWVQTDDDWPPAHWPQLRDDVIGVLTERRRPDSATESAELVHYATPLAHVDDPEVYCWNAGGWAALNEEWEVVESDEFRLDGFADPVGGTIDLAAYVCDPLHRFFGGDYTPNLNEASLELAAALVTLAHEAEHLRRPKAEEDAVECVALQRARDLVRAAGRGRPYQELMAGLAWDVAYPDMPDDYRTSRCRNGGPYDVRPQSAVWP